MNERTKILAVSWSLKRNESDPGYMFCLNRAQPSSLSEEDGLLWFLDRVLADVALGR